jgi:high-affinity Fe2+/Pb2+ permease
MVDAQSVLLLLVAAVLVAVGFTQFSRARKQNLAQRQRNRMGSVLIVVGVIVGLIALLGNSLK